MDQERIGKYIASLRKKKNMTQEELAEKLGVNSRSVSRWENGKCMPDLSLLTPLSKELGTNINDLISGEDVNQNIYQEKFEENVVDMVSIVEKKNHISNLLSNTFLGIIILFTVLFVGYIFYTNVSFKASYNKDKMYITSEYNGDLSYSNDIAFCTKNDYIGRVNRLITVFSKDSEEVGIVFVHVRRTLQDIYHEYNAINDYGNYNLSTGKTCQNLYIPVLEFPKHYQIYYTETSFKKIANASNEELEKIIKKANLMYDSFTSKSE